MTSRDKYDIFSGILEAAGRTYKGSRIIEVTKEVSLDGEHAKEVVIDMLEIGLLEFKRRKYFKNNCKRLAIRKDLSEFKTDDVNL
jgi:hypothetical protein